MISEAEMSKSAIFDVLTVREVMEDFKIRQQKTVQMACLTGRVAARKADSEPGQTGGIWLIDRKSAELCWGYRLKEGFEDGEQHTNS